MQYTTVTAPRWANAAHTAIDLTVTFDGVGTLPFTASADDAEAHSQELFTSAAAGDFGAVAAYVAPPVSREQQLAAIEAERDATIAAGVLHEGSLYHADDTFLTEMLGRIMGYQSGVYSGPLPVRTKENTTILLDQVQHVALAAAVGAHRQAAYSKSWADKDALP